MYRGARGGRRPAHPGARRRGGRALRALHVLSRIDAVDRERTKAYAYRPGAAVGERGTVASLAPIIGEDSLYGCVLESDMTLSTAGIDGPRIFRVPRWDLWPVVTGEIKDALERLGATGVSYTSLRPTP